MASLATTPLAGQNHDRFHDHDHDHDHSQHHRHAPPNATVPPTDDEGAPSDPVEITALQKMLSATSGSLLTGIIATPLDVVRVRLQSQHVLQPQPLPADFRKLAVSTPNAFRPSNLGVTACCREVFFANNAAPEGAAAICVAGPRIGSGAAATAGAECAVEQAQQRTFHSTMDGLRKIARNEGVFTLWRGLSPTLVMAVPANIIYFTGYEWLRYNPQSPIARVVAEPYAPLVAGSVARILAATSVSPIELFRTRLQASHGESAAGHVRDTMRGVREMVSTHGYRSLWRGLTLTLWRDVPFSGMYWWGYETIRGKLTDVRERHRGRDLELDSGRGRARRRSQSRENHRDTFTDSFIAGAGSGAIASVATMPFDVGKTRTQVTKVAAHGGAKATGGHGGSSSSIPEGSKMIRLLWHIFKTEGVPGLFRGWIPRTLRVAPACAIMISSYEVGKKAFRGVNERALAREFAPQRKAD